MRIEKHDISFNVSGDYSEEWFGGGERSPWSYWESYTFHILDHYKGGTYIDIGAWIGPTVLYSANLYDRVIAVEPDVIALLRLEENLNANNFSNISIVKKGLSDNNGKSVFGGNGPLGNSESTLLINDKEDFFSYEGRHTNIWTEHDTVQIDTITIDTLIKEYDIDVNDINLIKLDVEGGEKIIIPHIKEFLNIHKPTFYVSLHYCYLRDEEAVEIVNTLFEIYDKCFIVSNNGIFKQVNKKEVLSSKSENLVFEK
jgi:FkbM family methyltransferase